MADGNITVEVSIQNALTADVFEALDLSPEQFLTDGGSVNRGKLRAALWYPHDYLPEGHWMRAADEGRLRAENAALKRDLQYARDGLTKGRTRMREDNERLRDALQWIDGATAATPGLTDAELGRAMAAIGKKARDALGA